MSTPKTIYPNALQGILQEIISAQSALNMPPKPIEGKNDDGVEYLSNIDVWAEHAYNHLSAAVEILIDYQRTHKHEFSDL